MTNPSPQEQINAARDQALADMVTAYEQMVAAYDGYQSQVASVESTLTADEARATYNPDLVNPRIGQLQAYRIDDWYRQAKEQLGS